jgi:hypothetical protein
MWRIRYSVSGGYTFGYRVNEGVARASEEMQLSQGDEA